MSAGWAFAYGSLVSAESASATLGRDVEPVAATLRGWRRGWTQARDNARVEKRFERLDGSRIAWCLALNIVADPRSEVNGAIIELRDGELERLDERELRYDRVEVGEAVLRSAGEPAAGRVHAWTAKPRHRFETPPRGAVIIAAYLEAVESAFGALGAAELERFRQTTGKPPCEVVAARLLTGDGVAPGNPRRW